MLKNANIARRLTVGFGVVILLLVVMGGITRFKMGMLADLTTRLYRHPFTVSTNLLDAKANIAGMQQHVLEVLLAGNTEEIERAAREMAEHEKQARDDLKTVGEFYLGNPDDVKTVVSCLDDWKPLREKVIELIRTGNRQEALAFQKTTAGPLIAGAEEKILVIEAFAADEARSFLRGAEETAAATYFLVYVLIVVAIAVSLVIAMLTSRSICQPLNTAVEVANRIAVGDLTMALPEIKVHDEVGELIQAFERMVLYLREMAEVAGQIAARNLDVRVKPHSNEDLLGNAFMAMIDNLREMINDLQNSSGILASAVGEILATTTQLASGITETATSVSETTATVEEVRQTAQLAADKSLNVAENAKEAVAVAEKGDAAVAETMDGISNIKGLMEVVAESVVTLSEQTQAIGEIITSVNDLTQQSNLLAVNAAIEASKAGEQGKGFAVVATEIRSLADQSKQATEQVRTILSDIQKATTRSVLATEQVSKAVDGGVKQAAESGESIRRLAESIGQAAQAATQIAASSQQQLAGMDQVAMAMDSVKQAARQNVEGTRQAEQAAHTLNDLGRNLQAMVATYKV